MSERFRTEPIPDLPPDKMTFHDRRNFLGAMGEHVLGIFMEEKMNYAIIEAESPKDDEKDFFGLKPGEIAQLKLEMKVQRPYVTKKLFSFETSQYSKIINCDELIIGAIPVEDQPWEHEGKIFRSRNTKGLTWSWRYDVRYAGTAPKDMVDFNIDLRNLDVLEIIGEIEDKRLLKLLKKYSLDRPTEKQNLYNARRNQKNKYHTEED
jgi:hypothetical protein